LSFACINHTYYLKIKTILQIATLTQCSNEQGTHLPELGPK